MPCLGGARGASRVRCLALPDLLERVAKECTAGFRGDCVRGLENFEAKLAAGEIAEAMHFKRRKDLEVRYASVF